MTGFRACHQRRHPAGARRSYGVSVLPVAVSAALQREAAAWTVVGVDGTAPVSIRGICALPRANRMTITGKPPRIFSKKRLGSAANIDGFKR